MVVDKAAILRFIIPRGGTARVNGLMRPLASKRGAPKVCTAASYNRASRVLWALWIACLRMSARLRGKRKGQSVDIFTQQPPNPVIACPSSNNVDPNIPNAAAK